MRPVANETEDSGAASVAESAVPRIGGLIRERRRQAKLTLQTLCAEAGLSVGYLSQIERDQATPSLATLTQIARTLGVGVEYFIAVPKAEDALSLAEGRARFHIEGSSIVYEKLSTEFPGSQIAAYIMHVPPGYQSETVSHEGEEFLYLLDGEITQWLGADQMLLRPGDALHYRGSLSHAWANRTDRPAHLLWTGRLTMFQTALSQAPEPLQKPEDNPVSPTPVPRRKRT